MNYYIEGEAITFAITDPSPGVYREGAKHQLVLSTALTNNTTVMLTDDELYALGMAINARFTEPSRRAFRAQITELEKRYGFRAAV